MSEKQLKSQSLLPRVTAELIRVMHGALETAVTHKSAETGMDVIVEYFEEAGTGDHDTQRLLDQYWEMRQ